MKMILTLCAAFFLFGSTVQAQSLNKVGPQQFWETNIQAILDQDIDLVVEQSHFPMSTFEGDWKENDFRDAFEILFDETTLAALKSQTFRDIQAVENEPGDVTYMVVILTEMEVDGEMYESATILSFMKFDGVWKLYNIDMAG